MIIKKKWDEKGKTMQFEVKTRDGKPHYIKNKKKSERVREAKKIRFEEFCEVWQLAHARGNIAF